ncbi:unnamed protein product (macronuclear) [Paramecium tetraurelia]|uniref:Uncharacterized protein n=1 Tax=Paramecium tetraurelia TaxID=5888 RepID=A0DUI8_PARTE|nr:uncharacterized protein GSPATT00020377001 [Paramecium tetraurelia]CAK86705.1 unnamed protein product [Paramecium tetraurelia]|eukprot:XP_001454102.1 hypothetical protein (macronuclear) [Paramecium tetraurelia strain d4-2]
MGKDLTKYIIYQELYKQMESKNTRCDIQSREKIRSLVFLNNSKEEQCDPYYDILNWQFPLIILRLLNLSNQIWDKLISLL